MLCEQSEHIDTKDFIHLDMSLTIRILFIFNLLHFLSCKPPHKAAETDKVIETTYQIGNYYFQFKQFPSDSECFYHQLEKEKLVEFIELNHDGNKDDKPPRQLESFVETKLLKREPKGSAERIQTKICMNKQGQVLAARHEYTSDTTVAEQLTTDLMNLQYKATQHARAMCIECKTEYFSVTN